MKILEDIQNFLDESESLGKPPVLAIIGPTASGKTALSLEIAKKFNGEIVSADSRQIYKYMDIGTEKISQSEMQGITHHLLDIVNPDQEFTLADYKRKAVNTIKDIHKRGKLPILCGGTGLYLNAIIENYQIPRVPPQFDLRQQLAQYYEEHGAQALHKLLQERDPDAAAKIHPNNVRYVIRALEIFEAGLDSQPPKGKKIFNIFTVGIDWPRESLYERINSRVHDQIDRGLLNEVKTLMHKGYNPGLPALSSIGYSEIIEFLNGDVTLEEAIENIKKNTRNYCKRQLTWFRRYQNINWINGDELQGWLQQPN